MQPPSGIVLFLAEIISKDTLIQQVFLSYPYYGNFIMGIIKLASLSMDQLLKI